MREKKALDEATLVFKAVTVFMEKEKKRGEVRRLKVGLAMKKRLEEMGYTSAEIGGNGIHLG